MMERALEACHVQVQHKTFEDRSVSHASFVTDWKPLSTEQCSNPKGRPASGKIGPGPQKSSGVLDRKQGLPVFLEAIVSNLQGFRSSAAGT